MLHPSLTIYARTMKLLYSVCSRSPWEYCVIFSFIFILSLLQGDSRFFSEFSYMKFFRLVARFMIFVFVIFTNCECFWSSFRTDISCLQEWFKIEASCWIFAIRILLNPRKLKSLWHPESFAGTLQFQTVRKLNLVQAENIDPHNGVFIWTDSKMKWSQRFLSV